MESPARELVAYFAGTADKIGKSLLMRAAELIEDPQRLADLAAQLGDAMGHLHGALDNIVDVIEKMEGTDGQEETPTPPSH